MQVLSAVAGLFSNRIESVLGEVLVTFDSWAIRAVLFTPEWRLPGVPCMTCRTYRCGCGILTNTS